MRVITTTVIPEIVPTMAIDWADNPVVGPEAFAEPLVHWPVILG